MVERELVTTPAAKTVAEFCRDWRISQSTFYQLVKSEKLRTVKIGRVNRVMASDEMAFANTLRESA